MDISPTHHYARNDRRNGPHPARAAAENDPNDPRKTANPQGRTKEEIRKILQYQCRTKILVISRRDDFYSPATMRWSIVRATRVSTVSRERNAASATVGPSRVRSAPRLSVVCLSTLAMRRATTWAVTRSVSVNAIMIEPSWSRQ